MEYRHCLVQCRYFFAILFGVFIDLHYLSPLVKIGSISKMKINHNLFCILLDLHYLCIIIATRSRISNCSLKLMNLLFR